MKPVFLLLLLLISAHCKQEEEKQEQETEEALDTLVDPGQVIYYQDPDDQKKTKALVHPDYLEEQRVSETRKAHLVSHSASPNGKDQYQDNLLGNFFVL